MSSSTQPGSRRRVRTIRIAYDYTRTPGGRSPKNGAFSGEDFRLTVLEPALRQIPANYDRIIVDLDGVDTYIGSFLEEAFGGLLRGMFRSPSEVFSRLDLQATGEFKTFRDLAIDYVNEQGGRNLIKGE